MELLQSGKFPLHPQKDLTWELIPPGYKLAGNHEPYTKVWLLDSSNQAVAHYYTYNGFVTVQWHCQNNYYSITFYGAAIEPGIIKCWQFNHPYGGEPVFYSG